MKARTRPAFSLFELLLVIAIIAFLVGLLMPAVSRVRQSAARVSSLNNLKQLALACHAYHDSFNTLPPGVDANNFSAAAYLLPYIEQQAVFQTIDFKKPMTDNANAEARAVQFKVFLSPQDPVTTVAPGLGATNYLFSAGSKYSLTDNDGVFYRDSKTSLVAITDGTSNTLMIGETLKGDGAAKAVSVQRQYVRLKDAKALKDLTEDSGVKDFQAGQDIAGDRCASWMDGRFLMGTFTATRVGNDDKPDVSCDGQGGLSGLRSPGDTFNVALCDGSVRTLNTKVDLKVWQALATRAGGEVVNLP